MPGGGKVSGKYGKMQHVTDGDRQICLCHYPLAEWYKSRHSSWLIYGHIHAARDEVYEFMKTRERALNAAACINNYTPASFNELIRNNEYFQQAGNEVPDKGGRNELLYQ